MDKFCSECGKPLPMNAAFCPACGKKLRTAEAPMTTVQVTAPRTDRLLKKYTAQMIANGVIWIVTAAIQIIPCGILAALMREREMTAIFFVSAAFNLVLGVTVLRNSKKDSIWPVGIVEDTKPVAKVILYILYGIVFGGVLGLAGAIQYLFGVRNLVMKHEQCFLELEKAAIAASNKAAAQNVSTNT